MRNFSVDAMGIVHLMALKPFKRTRIEIGSCDLLKVIEHVLYLEQLKLIKLMQQTCSFPEIDCFSENVL